MRSLLGMKRLFFSALFFAASLSFSFAEIVLLERSEVGGEKQETTLKIKGGRMRSDASEAMSVIIDPGADKAITLLHGDRTARIDSLKGLHEMMGANGAEAPKGLTPKGEKRTIDGHETELYTVTLMDGTMEVRLWIAKEHPDKALYLEASKVRDGVFGNPFFGNARGEFALPGVPLLVEASIASANYTVTTTFVSIERKEVPESDFAVPSGYTEKASH